MADSNGLLQPVAGWLASPRRVQVRGGVAPAVRRSSCRSLVADEFSRDAARTRHVMNSRCNIEYVLSREKSGDDGTV